MLHIYTLQVVHNLHIIESAHNESRGDYNMISILYYVSLLLSLILLLYNPHVYHLLFIFFINI